MMRRYRPASLTEGCEGSSGHVWRSDTVEVSGRYFSEEKICVVSGYEPVRSAEAGVLDELQHKQCRHTLRQTAVM
ncbi:hypothetical protein PBY51_019996 [Eleginops maclovinus]|uniref:Uncharacterized protein n=1 Tax=Eleginops maclovinus TaxID=56733 RepID=A0AAN8AK91_ELEMC|nr:hypothetical protein PBY51_019996 [Eleginops maclovinus]